MKLAIYRFGLFLFIAVLLPRAMPAGQREIKRAALTTDGDNPALQSKTEEQDQTQVPEQRQDRETVIRDYILHARKMYNDSLQEISR